MRFLKNRFFALLLFLFVMAALPLSVVRCDRGAPSAAARDSADSAESPPSTEKPDDSREQAVSCAASLCREDFCAEALRAAVILANTNRDAWKDMHFDSSEELKERVRAVYFSDKELLWQNETKYIPVSLLSPADKHKQTTTIAYLTSVASPWDCLSEEYDENLRCVGVSMNGVNYLCAKGYSAEDALLYYLPDFSVSS